MNYININMVHYIKRVCLTKYTYCLPRIIFNNILSEEKPSKLCDF